MSPAGKTAVNALGDTLTLDIAADVFSDTSATPLKNEAVTGFVVEQTAAPQLSTAAYDENTRKLTLVFTESDINVSDFKVTGIKVNNVALTAKSTVDTTANGKTVVISVGPDTVITSGGLLAIDATAAKNTAGTAVIPATNKAITFTADTTKPVINAVEFNDGTMELTFKLSELIDFTKFGAVTGIKLTDGTRSYALTDSTFLGAAAAANNSSTVRVQLSATDATAILTTANTKLDLTKLKVEVAADTFKDVSIAANGNLVINTANAIVVQYVDNAAPTATIAAGQSSTTAVVTFSEKVNAEQAKNPANYTLKAGLVTLPVTSAYLGVDGMTVTLTTAEQSAVDYVLTLNNITDLKGNAYVNPTDPTSFVKFTGVPVTADTVKPEVISAIYVDNGNGEPGPGDQIKVTFSEPIATPIANVKFADFDFGSAFTGMTADNTTFAYGSTNEQIIITLGTGATVTWADPANVTVNSSAASGLKDAAGNAADGKNASSVTTAQQLAAPGGTAQIVSVTYTDANGDYTKSVGDKITIKFNKAVKLGATPKADDLFDAAEAGVLGVVDSGTYAAMTLDTADTIVITTTAVPTVAFKATDAIAGNATTVKVTDAWGQAVTKLGTGIAVTKADASNATLTSASYNKTTKKLTLTFSASLLTAKTSDGSLATELVVLSGGAPATLTGNFIPENAAALKSGQIVLDVADAADQAILESGVATIQIEGGGSAKIATNAYDAKVLPAAQPITVTVTQ